MLFLSRDAAPYVLYRLIPNPDLDQNMMAPRTTVDSLHRPSASSIVRMTHFSQYMENHPRIPSPMCGGGEFVLGKHKGCYLTDGDRSRRLMNVLVPSHPRMLICYLMYCGVVYGGVGSGLGRGGTNHQMVSLVE